MELSKLEGETSRFFLVGTNSLIGTPGGPLFFLNRGYMSGCDGHEKGYRGSASGRWGARGRSDNLEMMVKRCTVRQMT